MDALAIAIGNAHGNYPVAPKLALDVLEEIHNRVDIPLVLHGGSGITDEDFRKAISLGIVKVNIATASFNRLTLQAEEYLRSNGAHNHFTLNEAMVQGTYRSPEALEKADACTAAHFHPPVILAVAYELSVSWKRETDGKDHGEIDFTIVATQIMLQAADLGLGTTYGGGCPFCPAPF